MFLGCREPIGGSESLLSRHAFHIRLGAGGGREEDAGLGWQGGRLGLVSAVRLFANAEADL